MRELFLSSDAKQNFQVPITGFDPVDITIEYKPSQYGWFLSLVWGDFSLNNERISISPNLLRQFKNLIPFGILVAGFQAEEPIFVESWLNNNQFYILEQDELITIETEFYA
jgi:hypothetical protein